MTKVALALTKPDRNQTDDNFECLKSQNAAHQSTIIGCVNVWQNVENSELVAELSPLRVFLRPARIYDAVNWRKNKPDRVPRPYLEEGQVAVSIDACDLQIAHDDLAVLVELLQGAVLLVQVREGAQLVFRARAN